MSITQVFAFIPKIRKLVVWICCTSLVSFCFSGSAIAIDLGFACTHIPNNGTPYYNCVYNSGQSFHVYQVFNPSDYAELQAFGPNPILNLGDGTCTTPAGPSSSTCISFADSYWQVWIDLYWQRLFPLGLTITACFIILKHLRIIL